VEVVPADHEELDDQLAQRQQRARAELADGEGNRAERTDRGEVHDVADDLEQGARGGLDHLHHRRAALADRGQRHTEQHRHEQHLQHMRFGEGTDQRVGDDRHDVGHDRLIVRAVHVALDAGHVDGGRVDVHPRTGLPDIHHHQADDQRQDGDDFEVDQRLQGQAAHAAHVAHAGDAMHHRNEDDRPDHHPDQFDEGVAEGLHRRADVRLQPPHQHADHGTCHHLEPELANNAEAAQPLLYNGHINPPRSQE